MTMANLHKKTSYFTVALLQSIADVQVRSQDFVVFMGTRKGPSSGHEMA
jgi:hypothetical protein